MDFESLLVLTMVLFAPTLIMLLVWALVTTYRIYTPEKIIPFEQDPTYFRMQAIKRGESVRVGVTEIYEDQQRLQRETPPVEYEYPQNVPHRFPEAWQDSLWMRRN